MKIDTLVCTTKKKKSIDMEEQNLVQECEGTMGVIFVSVDT